MANTWTTLLDAVYPVGAIYQSWSATSPATLFGGSWTNLNGGRYLTLVSTSDTAGTSVGANSVTLTIETMPSHTHSISPRPWTSPVATYYGGDISCIGDWGDEPVATATGGGKAHENRPLSYYIYGWRRTA